MNLPREEARVVVSHPMRHDVQGELFDLHTPKRTPNIKASGHLTNWDGKYGLANQVPFSHLASSFCC